MKLSSFSRRRLILGGFLLPAVSMPGQKNFAPSSKAPKTLPPGPWKWDTILWDEDKRRLGSIGREFYRLKDRSLVLRLEKHDEQGYSSDTYSASIGSFLVRSDDGGWTWQAYDGPVLEENQTRLSDGTLIKVYSGGAVSLEERRALLASVGANPASASREGNDLWPESKQGELEAQGYQVERSYPGVVGTLTALSCSRSGDGGKTYQHKRIEGLPQLARLFGSFRRCIELRNGTLLAACFGKRRRGDPHFSFVVRSVDKGLNWDFFPVAEDLSGNLDFNETEIFELPNGKVIAMFRSAIPAGKGPHESSAGQGTYLYQSFSDDGGIHWTPFQRTPIWGYPAHLILLKSGKLLCTYAHRRHPFGVRACLSADLGNTWDYKNEKVIRDDSLPGLVDYPTSIQLDDGTILTAYTISKIPRLPYREDDQVGPSEDLLIHRRQRVGKEQRWNGGYHGIAALSRYSESYVRAAGQTTSRTKWSQETGSDEE